MKIEIRFVEKVGWNLYVSKNGSAISLWSNDRPNLKINGVEVNCEDG